MKLLSANSFNLDQSRTLLLNKELKKTKALFKPFYLLPLENDAFEIIVHKEFRQKMLANQPLYSPTILRNIFNGYYQSYFPFTPANQLVVLRFNATLTATVISWRLAFSDQY